MKLTKLDKDNLIMLIKMQIEMRNFTRGFGKKTEADLFEDEYYSNLAIKIKKL